MRVHVQMVRSDSCFLFTVAVVFSLSFTVESTVHMTSSFGRGRCPDKSLATVVIEGVRSSIDCGIRCLRQSPDGSSNRCVECSHRQDDRTCALFTNKTISSTFIAEESCTHFMVCTAVRMVLRNHACMDRLPSFSCDSNK